jgi:peptidoglycan hydrolase-like protein with peptidoglycan-binding domain
MQEAANVRQNGCNGSGGGTQPPVIPPFPGTNIGMGSTGNNVRVIQQAINALAPYYPGRLWTLNVDGIYGPNTRDAIFTFQSIFGLQITGIVGEVTWNRLMTEAAKVMRNVPAGTGAKGLQTCGTNKIQKLMFVLAASKLSS